MRIRIPAFPILALLVSAILATGASAATYTVGPGGTCTHANLQAAVDAAASHPGADEVRIVRTATWTGIQVSTQTDQDVEISGGWTTCTSQQPTGRTVLDGSGGQARSVIALRGNGRFTLRNLEITGGDQAGDDDGGGIHFRGGGVVHVIDSLISGNSADEGGGLYAHGTANTAEVVLENTVVSFNTARRHGGGVVAHALEMVIRGAQGAIMFNTAGASGGGLLVRSSDFLSYAYVSGGTLGIYGNSAARGGGIAVIGGEDSNKDAQVQVFSTDGNPVLIAGNSASERGGGIDLQPDADLFPTTTYAHAVANLRNVRIEDNTAPVGAAIHLAHDNYGPGGLDAIGGEVYFNVPSILYPLHPTAAPCPFGKPCGFIRNNSTGNTSGAIVHQSENARFHGSRIAFDGNAGGWLIYLSGEERTTLRLDNSLIAGNTVQHALIRDDQNEDDGSTLTNLHYLTITGNTIGANGVLSINEDMALTRSIVDQPGKALIATDVGSTGGSRDIQYVLLNQPGGPIGTTLAVPRFVDPANGDYVPRAGSLAVDYAPPASFTQDLFGQPRAVDLSLNPNDSGISDVGALERQNLQPLVLNPDFDTDLNQWEMLAPSSRDASQNISGPDDSGSLSANLGVDQARVAVRRQCIHLPGPGLYALDGWGRVTGTAPLMPPNRVWLDWELRYNAGYSGCSGFAPVATGSLQLATTGSWTQPPVPAIIDVPAANWGANASLTVYLVVQNGSPIAPGANGAHGPNAVLGGPSGWFDGIRIMTEYDETIFRDGFD